jgi:epidermal growth factor receptor substrate 15
MTPQRVLWLWQPESKDATPIQELSLGPGRRFIAMAQSPFRATQSQPPPIRTQVASRGGISGSSGGGGGSGPGGDDGGKVLSLEKQAARAQLEAEYERRSKELEAQRHKNEVDAAKARNDLLVEADRRGVRGRHRRDSAVEMEDLDREAMNNLEEDEMFAETEPQQRLREAQDAIATYLQKINGLELDLEQHRAEARAASGEVTDLEGRLLTEEREKQVLEQTRNRLREVTVDLERKKTEAEANLREAEERLEQRDMQYRESSEELERKRKEKEDELNEAIDQLTEMQDKERENRRAVQEMQRQLREAEMNVRQLGEKGDADLLEYERKIADFRAKLQAREQSIRDLEANLADNSTYESQRAAIEEAQANSEELRTELETITTRYNNSVQVASDYSREIQRLNAQSETIRTRLTTAERELEQSQRNTDNTERYATALQADMMAAAELHGATQRQLEIAINENRSQLEWVAESTQTVTQLRERIREVEQSLGEATNDRNRIQEELTATDENLTDTQRLYRLSEEQVAAHRARIEELSDRPNVTLADVAALREQAELANSTATIHYENLTQLREEQTTLQDTLRSTQRDLERRNAELERMSSRISELSQTLTAPETPIHRHFTPEVLGISTETQTEDLPAPPPAQHLEMPAPEPPAAATAEPATDMEIPAVRTRPRPAVVHGVSLQDRGTKPRPIESAREAVNEKRERQREEAMNQRRGITVEGGVVNIPSDDDRTVTIITPSRSEETKQEAAQAEAPSTTAPNERRKVKRQLKPPSTGPYRRPSATRAVTVPARSTPAPQPTALEAQEETSPYVTPPSPDVSEEEEENGYETPTIDEETRTADMPDIYGDEAQESL